MGALLILIIFYLGAVALSAWRDVDIVHGHDSACQFLVELLGASSMHLKVHCLVLALSCACAMSLVWSEFMCGSRRI